MSEIKAQVVADSKDSRGNRLFSVLVTFPRFILAELNTHRMLSKNSASSRAIPFRKLVEMVKTNPFIPIAWQKDHKGMQGSEYFLPAQDEHDKEGTEDIESEWLEARDSAIFTAEQLNQKGVTKQLCNRLLEPFMWHTVLVTGTDDGWNNFFELRCPQYEFEVEYADGNYVQTYKSRKEATNDGLGRLTDLDELGWLKANKGQAEIHMMALAEAIYDQWNESKPKELKEGEWHIPFKDKIDDVKLSKYSVYAPVSSNIPEFLADMTDLEVKVSTAMAARTSYTVVGDEKEVSYETLLGIYEKMANSKPWHASPFEHCAQCMSDEEYVRWVRGKLIDGKFEMPNSEEDAEGWCRNFKGFVQLREKLENK